VASGNPYRALFNYPLPWFFIAIREGHIDVMVNLAMEVSRVDVPHEDSHTFDGG